MWWACLGWEKSPPEILSLGGQGELGEVED